MASMPIPVTTSGVDAVLDQERAQAAVDLVGVRRRHGNFLRTDGLEALDDAVAHRRRTQPRSLRDGLAQLLVVLLAVIEGQRRAGQLDGVGARGRELLGRGRNARDHRVEAFRRHALDAEPRHDVSQSVAVHREPFLGHTAIERREDQPEHRRLVRGQRALHAEPGGQDPRGRAHEKVTSSRIHSRIPLRRFAAVIEEIIPEPPARTPLPRAARAMHTDRRGTSGAELHDDEPTLEHEWGVPSRLAAPRRRRIRARPTRRHRPRAVRAGAGQPQRRREPHRQDPRRLRMVRRQRRPQHHRPLRRPALLPAPADDRHQGSRRPENRRAVRLAQVDARH